MDRTEETDAGHVYGATARCLGSFDNINTSPSDFERVSKHLHDNIARFRIWAGNIGAWHPKLDKRSADYRLRDAPEVEDRIVELLDELTETNGDIQEIVSGSHANRGSGSGSGSDDDSKPSDSDGGKDELSDLLLSVGDVITSLMKVSMLVRKATGRDRYLKANQRHSEPFIPHFDIRHVADRFTKIRDQQWLLERLGGAITQRRQYLRYSRDHKNRIAHVGQRETATHKHDNAVLHLPEVPGVAALQLPPSARTVSTRPTLAPTTASTLQAEQLQQESLQNLDEDDDAISQATSFVSSRAEGDGSGYLHVVRLQDLTKSNEPFECPYCFAIVQAKRQRSWKQHVFADLRAYVCTFADCNAGLFDDRNAWWQHEMEAHRRQWSCQTCHDIVFCSAEGLHHHLRQTHGAQSLPSEVIVQIAEASSRPVSEIAALDCPLCDQLDVDLRNEASRMQKPIPDQHRVVTSLRIFRQHLGFHLEQLALFALPVTIDGNTESGSRHSHRDHDRDAQAQSFLRWQSGLLNNEGEEISPRSEIGLDSASDDEFTAAIHDAERSVPSIVGRSDSMTPVETADSESVDVQLCYAILENRGHKTRLPLFQGADPNAKFLSGLQGVSLDLSSGPRLLHVAIAENCPTAFEALILNLRTNINISDNNGWTSLHFAANLNATQFIELIFDHHNHDIAIDLLDNAGRTPLSLAAGNGFVQPMKLLLNHNADPNRGDCLLHSVLNQKYQAAQELISRGANVNVSCQHLGYVSVLGAACARYDEQMMELLLNSGADVNAIGSPDDNAAYGTPLVTAIMRASIEGVNLLISRGADVRLAGPRGDPLSVARVERESNVATVGIYDQIIDILESRLAETADRTASPQAMDQTTTDYGPQTHTPWEQQSTTIYRPGDVVYLPQQEGDRLRYSKAVFLRRQGDGVVAVREWTSQKVIATSVSQLVRKSIMTAEELEQAESLRDHTVSPVHTEEMKLKDASWYTLRNTKLLPKVMTALEIRVTSVVEGHGTVSYQDPDLILSFRAFLREFKTPTLRYSIERERRLEEVIRMFYTNASLELQQKAPQGDGTWKPAVEEHAALLLLLLVEVLADDGWMTTRPKSLELLREEIDRMLARADELRQRHDRGATALTLESVHSRFAVSHEDLPKHVNDTPFPLDVEPSGKGFTLGSTTVDVVAADRPDLVPNLESMFSMSDRLIKLLESTDPDHQGFESLMPSLRRLMYLIEVLVENLKSMTLDELGFHSNAQGALMKASTNYLFSVQRAIKVIDGSDTEHVDVPNRDNGAFLKTLAGVADAFSATLSPLRTRTNNPTPDRDTLLDDTKPSYWNLSQEDDLLGTGTEPNDSDMYLSLQQAVMDQDHDAASRILTGQLDISLRSTAVLLQALSRADARMLKILLEHGGNALYLMTEPDKLLEALATTSTEALEVLLDRVPAIKDARDDAGQTLLHMCTSCELKKATLSLLKLGVEVNAIDLEGNTALDLLLSKPLTEDRKGLVNMLLDHKAAARSIQDISDSRSVSQTLQWYEHLRTDRIDLDSVFSLDLETILQDQLASRERAASLLSTETQSEVSPRSAGPSADSTVSTRAQEEQERALTVNDPFPGMLSDAQIDVDAWFAAVHRNGLYGIEKLLDEGFDVDQRDIRMYTALHHAAKRGSLDLAKILINAKADLSLPLPQGNTALHIAAEYGHVSVVKLLLEHGARVNARNWVKDTPLAVAVQHGKDQIYEVAEQLLDHGASTRFSRTSTILHTVLDREDVDSIAVVFESLLNRDSGLASIPDEHGSTPLHTCVQRRLPWYADRLLMHGADVNARDVNGQTPLDLLFLRESNKQGAEMSGILIQNGARYDPDRVNPDLTRDLDELQRKADPPAIIETSPEGREQSVDVQTVPHSDILIRVDAPHDSDPRIRFEGASPDLTSSRGVLNPLSSDRPAIVENGPEGHEHSLEPQVTTNPELLHLTGPAELFGAIERGDDRAVTRLMAGGADPDSFDDNMTPALVRAAETDNPRTLAALLTHKANLNIRNKEGQTALHGAARFNCGQSVSYLLSRGAEVDPLDGNGDTPFILAVKHWADTSLLKSFIDASEELSRTALFSLLQFREDPVDALKFFIDANPALVNDATGGDRWTPLHYAVSNLAVSSVSLLITRGAHVNATTHGGETPLRFLLGQNLEVEQQVKASRIFRIMRSSGAVVEGDLSGQETARVKEQEWYYDQGLGMDEDGRWVRMDMLSDQESQISDGKEAAGRRRREMQNWLEEQSLKHGDGAKVSDKGEEELRLDEGGGGEHLR